MKLLKNSFGLIWKAISLSVLLFILVLGLPQTVRARPIETPGRVIIVLVDKIGLEELSFTKTPFLNDLQKRSALGLVSSRYIKDNQRQGAFTFITTGCRPGAELPVSSNLSDLLQEIGAETLIINGEEISDSVQWAPLKLSNPEKVMEREGSLEAQLILIDLADGLEIEEKQSILGDDSFILIRNNVIKHIDSFLAEIYKRLSISSADSFLVYSPSPPKKAQKEFKRLGWLILSHDSIPGQLYSSSTRRDGLIIASDIMPTILTHFEIPLPNNIEGQPLKVKANEKAMEIALTDLQIHANQYKHRTTYIQGFVALEIIVISLAILVLAGRLEPQFIPFLLLIHGALIILPILALFISPLVPLGWSFLLSLLIPLLLVLLIHHYVESNLARLGLMALLVHLTFWLSLIWFPNYFGQSLLGYSAIIGARFYGLGNEFMGFFLGSGILATSILYEKYAKSWLLFLAIMLMALGIGLPFWGANFGGLLTILTIGFFLIKKKGFLKPLLLPALVLSAVIVFEFKWGKSHLGHLLSGMLEGGGWPLFKQIIKSKIMINKSLWAWTPWTRVFILFLLGMVVALRHAAGKKTEVLNQMPRLKKGILALTWGSFFTIFFNDSGVVAGATTLYYAVHALLYIFLASYEKDNSNFKKIA